MTTKEKKTKKAPEELKVVVRKLPPTLTSEVFMKSIQAYKETVSYFYFVPGKNKYPINVLLTEREKSSKYGRAFLTFKKMDDKTNFLKNYKPSFIDDKGNIMAELFNEQGNTYLAKLEEALYQVDVANLSVKTNPKEGTYLESPEYKAFMEKLSGQKSNTISNEKKDTIISIEEQKKIDKTPLVLDIERRLAEKREKEEAKKKQKNNGPKYIYKEKNKDHDREYEKDKEKDRDYYEKDRDRDNRDHRDNRDRDNKDNNYNKHNKNQQKTYVVYQKKS